MPFIDRSQNIYTQTRWTNVKGGAIGNDPRVSYLALFIKILIIG